MKNEKRKKKKDRKKNINNHSFFFHFSLFSFLLLTGCTTIVQKGGEIVEGSTFTRMELALYRSGEKDRKERTGLKELRLNDGKIIMEIHSEKWPGLTLIGGMPSGNGSFELLKARILSSHVNGWNEFSLDILGSAFFGDQRKTGGTLHMAGGAERVQISSGSIRLKGNRLTDNAALTALRNRRERILALTEWMAVQTEVGGGKANFGGQSEFENYWKPLLFPELVSAKKRPTRYSTVDVEWRRMDGVKWNLSYTETLFPGDLWEYRNSGAMLRDWEEALAWIYIEYAWDFILDSFNDTYLIRIK